MSPQVKEIEGRHDFLVYSECPLLKDMEETGREDKCQLYYDFKCNYCKRHSDD
jgi:hypothetical protein